MTVKLLRRRLLDGAATLSIRGDGMIHPSQSLGVSVQQGCYVAQVGVEGDKGLAKLSS
ncbi:hypothetical protein GCM10011504_52470 [Siccirubricoccus deserti]|uniref:Uncharacterized protein n=1 Tax=Siccirubricoccus deserti TaxID=2013562 RepID=A0A9X0R5A2_9PROT|nr:hypothetical protein [Siccirubricoccus deserti]MBC4018727.1 hypothetical protein [Siccirubricoccus deserti]GGC68001.1 hypothetical protein GCM10011504_52470 [Siccirubricoccus deserti]